VLLPWRALNPQVYSQRYIAAQYMMKSETTTSVSQKRAFV